MERERDREKKRRWKWSDIFSALIWLKFWLKINDLAPAIFFFSVLLNEFVSATRLLENQIYCNLIFNEFPIMYRWSFCGWIEKKIHISESRSNELFKQIHHIQIWLNHINIFFRHQWLRPWVVSIEFVKNPFYCVLFNYLS